MEQFSVDSLRQMGATSHTVGSIVRKVIAIVAAPGFLAGVFIMGASFFGLTLDRLGMKAFAMHLGIFVLLIPLTFVEPNSKGRDLFRGKPRWAVRSIQTLFVFFVAVFIGFLVLSHGASPDIIGGEYVLNSHGRIVGHISERDYLSLKGWELRLFASRWTLAYYTLMMAWWFPRQNELTRV